MVTVDIVLEHYGARLELTAGGEPRRIELRPLQVRPNHRAHTTTPPPPTNLLRALSAAVAALLVRLDELPAPERLKRLLGLLDAIDADIFVAECAHCHRALELRSLLPPTIRCAATRSAYHPDCYAASHPSRRWEAGWLGRSLEVPRGRAAQWHAALPAQWHAALPSASP